MAWVNTKTSQIITEDAARVYSIILTTDTNGKGITLYDGKDAQSGRKIARFVSLANNTNTFDIAGTLFASRGLYVELDNEVVDFCIVYRNVWEEEEK